MHTIVTFQSHADIQNLERLPIKYMSSEMTRLVTHCQESLFTFGKSKSVVLEVLKSLSNVVDVITAVTIRLYFV